VFRESNFFELLCQKVHKTSEFLRKRSLVISHWADRAGGDSWKRSPKFGGMSNSKPPTPSMRRPRNPQRPGQDAYLSLFDHLDHLPPRSLPQVLAETTLPSSGQDDHPGRFFGHLEWDDHLDRLLALELRTEPGSPVR
jgi:hypothetical protein